MPTHARPFLVAALLGFAALYVAVGFVLIPLLTGHAVATTSLNATTSSSSTTTTTTTSFSAAARHTGVFVRAAADEVLGDAAVATCVLDTWSTAGSNADRLFRGADTSAVLARLGPGAVAVAYEHGRWQNGGSPAPRLVVRGADMPLAATVCTGEAPPTWSRARNTRLATTADDTLVLATEVLRGADLVADTPQVSAIDVWYTEATGMSRAQLAGTDGERVVALVASPAVAARIYLLSLRADGTLLLRQSDTRGRSWSPLHTHVIRTGVSYAQVAHTTLHFSRFSRDTLLVNIALDTGGFAFALSTNGGRTWGTGLTRGLLSPNTRSPDASWRALDRTLLDATYQPAPSRVNRTATLLHGLGAPRVTMNTAEGVVFSGALYAAVDGAVTHSMSDGMHWSPRIPLGAADVVVTGLAVSPAGVLAVAFEHTETSSAATWRVAFSVAFFGTRAGGLVHLDTLPIHAYNARKLPHTTGAFGGDGVSIVALGGNDAFVLAYAHVPVESASVSDAAVAPVSLRTGHNTVSDDAARRTRIHQVRIRRADKIGSPSV